MEVYEKTMGPGYDKSYFADIRSVKYLLRAFLENLKQLFLLLTNIIMEVRSDICNPVWNVTPRRTLTIYN